MKTRITNEAYKRLAIEVIKQTFRETENGGNQADLAVYDSLGTLTDRMYDLGYDEADIREQEELEQAYRDKSDILEEEECIKRGIKLWEE